MLRSEGDHEVDAFGSMICNAVEPDTTPSHAPRMKESSSPLSKKRKDRECSLRRKYHLPISTNHWDVRLKVMMVGKSQRSNNHLVYKVTAHGKCHAFFDIHAFESFWTPKWQGPWIAECISTLCNLSSTIVLIVLCIYMFYLKFWLCPTTQSTFDPCPLSVYTPFAVPLLNQVKHLQDTSWLLCIGLPLLELASCP